MNPFRSIIRKVHLLLGLSSGIVIFIVAITGCIYAFEEEIRSYLYRDLLFVNVPNKSDQKVSIDVLVDSVKKHYPKQVIKNIRFKNGDNSSVEVVFTTKESLYIHPYTKEVLGVVNKDKDFFGIVLKVHRSLYLGEPGKMITGISALIFVTMIISGIILWWPRTKKRFKRNFTILKNARLGRRIFDLHSVLGFYASWIIIFTAITGLIWSFKWMENSLYWITHSKKTETRNIRSQYIKMPAVISLDKLIATQKEALEKIEGYFISLPEDSLGVVRITILHDKDGFFSKYDQYFFDRYTGTLIKSKLYKDLSLGDKIKSTNYNIHTGKVFGLMGQLLVFFASLITASLPITGFMFWRLKST
jgi:uncharacterized iron-regulated membrane protein